MRWLSPRAVPEPSLSYLLIEPEPGFESAPASVNFETYELEAGLATGAVDQGVTFAVQCDRQGNPVGCPFDPGERPPAAHPTTCGDTWRSGG